MKGRVNCWPAIADLFAGLVIATFGALILFTDLAGKPDPVDQEARCIRAQAAAALSEALHGNVRTSGDDVYVDVQIEFDSDSDRPQPAFVKRLQDACRALKTTLGEENVRRNTLEIFIEGHADARLPRGVIGERDRYRYNWDLSARRASAVLYEFKGCGLEAPDYFILAVGFGDTLPLCRENTDDCHQTNRRTSFRLRPNKTRIEEMLTEGVSICAIPPLAKAK